MNFLTRALPVLLLFSIFNLGAERATALSSEMSLVINETASLGARPISYLAPNQARRQANFSDAVKSILAKQQRASIIPTVERVARITIPTSEAQLSAIVFKPNGIGLPVTVYFHGGGFVLGDAERYANSAIAIAQKTGSIVVSVNYRLAPEHMFPAAHNDAYAAYRWVLDNAAALGGDAGRVAVAGECAGANLAMNVAIRARDERVLMPIHVLALYPIADGTMTTPSYVEQEFAKPTGRATMAWFFSQYLNSSSELFDTRISLLRADLKALPPTTVITAEADPLRSEGAELAMSLRRFGTPVTYRTYEGVSHDFFGAADVVPMAAVAQDYATGELRRSFAAPLLAKR